MYKSSFNYSPFGRRPWKNLQEVVNWYASYSLSCHGFALSLRPFPFCPEDVLPLHCDYIIFLPPILLQISDPLITSTVHVFKLSPIQCDNF